MNTFQSFTQEESEFLGMLSLAHCGSMIAIISDQDIASIMYPILLFHANTQDDVIVYVHLHEYTHEEYIRFVKTLRINPPLDLSTQTVKGNDVIFDMQIHDDDSLDIVFVYYTKLSSLIDLFRTAWNKLKGHGAFLIKGINHSDTSRIQEIQTAFNAIPIPPGIHITISLVEKTQNLIFVKKPCYRLI